MRGVRNKYTQNKNKKTNSEVWEKITPRASFSRETCGLLSPTVHLRRQCFHLCVLEHIAMHRFAGKDVIIVNLFYIIILKRAKSAIVQQNWPFWTVLGSVWTRGCFILWCKSDHSEQFWDQFWVVVASFCGAKVIILSTFVVSFEWQWHNIFFDGVLRRVANRFASFDGARLCTVVHRCAPLCTVSSNSKKKCAPLGIIIIIYWFFKLL